MNRWILTLEGKEHKPLIYADTKEEAGKYFKDLNILEIKPYTNTDYLNDIEFLKRNSTLIRTENKGEGIRELYEVKMPDGRLIFKLSITDSIYLDFAMYQFMSKDCLIYPILFTMSNPKEVRDKFFGQPMTCEIPTYRIYGQPSLKKPSELKGVKQSFSVDFIPNKCKCQCFVNGNDLWIKHRDFFSASHRPSQNDVGTPLTFRLEKYFGMNKDYLEKFIYKDTWGDIVLRNEAWIVFRNFKPTIERATNSYPIKTLIKTFLESDVLKQNHITELSIDWEHFFEKLCKEYISYKEQV